MDRKILKMNGVFSIICMEHTTALHVLARVCVRLSIIQRRIRLLPIRRRAMRYPPALHYGVTSGVMPRRSLPSLKTRINVVRAYSKENPPLIQTPHWLIDDSRQSLRMHDERQFFLLSGMEVHFPISYSPPTPKKKV